MQLQYATNCDFLVMTFRHFDSEFVTWHKRGEEKKKSIFGEVARGFCLNCAKAREVHLTVRWRISSKLLALASLYTLGNNVMEIDPDPVIES